MSEGQAAGEKDPAEFLGGHRNNQRPADLYLLTILKCRLNRENFYSTGPIFAPARPMKLLDLVSLREALSTPADMGTEEGEALVQVSGERPHVSRLPLFLFGIYCVRI